MRRAEMVCKQSQPVHWCALWIYLSRDGRKHDEGMIQKDVSLWLYTPIKSGIWPWMLMILTSSGMSSTLSTNDGLPARNRCVRVIGQAVNNILTMQRIKEPDTFLTVPLTWSDSKGSRNIYQFSYTIPYCNFRTPHFASNVCPVRLWYNTKTVV